MSRKDKLILLEIHNKLLKKGLNRGDNRIDQIKFNSKEKEEANRTQEINLFKGNKFIGMANCQHAFRVSKVRAQPPVGFIFYSC